MALRKFLYLDSTEGVATEQSTSDTAQFGGLTLGGALGMGGYAIQNVGAPVNATDAATKGYADSISSGISVKPSCLALAATNVATMSGTATIDGVNLVAGNRVLLVGQTTPTQNGIWVVQTSGWTRATDSPAGNSASGTYTFIEQGTTYIGTGWVCTSTPGSDVIGTNNLAFTQFSGLGDVTAGSGLSKNVNTLSVALATNPGLQFVGGALGHLLDPASALYTTSAGLGVAINSTYLSASGSTLSVLGVPSAFTIAGTATSANVTAANLGTLTAGSASAADALHTHANILGCQNIQQTVTIGTTACSAGDPVAWSTTANTTVRSDASVSASARVIGLCSAAISASGTGTVVRDGVVTSCLTSATPGTPYWLAAGGGLTSTIPTASGNRVIRVGFAKNASDLQVKIQDMGTRN